jgi:hypothetical protein
MMVLLVDNSDPDLGMGKGARRLKAGKARADDDNRRLVRSQIICTLVVAACFPLHSDRRRLR